MKETVLSLISILALNQLTYAGGDMSPIEPVVDVPVVGLTWAF